MDKEKLKLLKKIISNRLFIFFLVNIFAFWILEHRLFELQIINGEMYALKTEATIIRTLPVLPIRGNIYDRFGQPLAINETVFNVKLNTDIFVEDINDVIFELLMTLENNNISHIDHLPITHTAPFEFTFSNDTLEKSWKIDMGFKDDQLAFTAGETIEYLREFFEISSDIPDEIARNIIAIRCEIFMQRYRQYNAVTLAEDVNQPVIAEIEEQSTKYPGIFIDIVPYRNYPEGEYFSHILGYIGSINEKELTAYEAYGYTSNDLIGKLGIEKAYELTLNGKKGEEVIEVTPTGKVMNRTIDIPPTNGQDVFLTIDSNLQKKTYDILLSYLKYALLQKFEKGELTIKQLFISMVRSNNISISSIMESRDNLTQGILKEIILEDNSSFNIQNNNDVEMAKEVIIKAIENNHFTSIQFIMCLIEQGIITSNDEMLRQLSNGNITPYEFIKEKIVCGEISPRTMNLDPCTGSVAVVDINTGDVLALVTYPSYDNNMLVNHFNNEYYEKLLDDPTTPLINRPLMERKAPGSTLKMLSAIAGLETGVITPTSKIQDLGVFKTAGLPYAKCLIYSRYGATHGAVDVIKAIEVSCNYFFYELAYRMGNAKNDTTLESIAILNDYMSQFGLDDYSGVEIEEYKPKMASPEVKENSIKSLDKEATLNQTRWMDGDTIRCAIGQSYNSFAAIHMAKYISTLANGGTRYKLNLVKGISRERGKEIDERTLIVEKEMRIKPEHLKAVYEGMLAVTTGSQGTLRNVFSGFEVQVAGKTGTAEESNKRPSHTWFTGFAPYDKPQVAIVVMIPFGESTSNIAPHIAKEIMIEYFGLKDQSKNSVYKHSLDD